MYVHMQLWCLSNMCTGMSIINQEEEKAAGKLFFWLFNMGMDDPYKKNMQLIDSNNES